MPRQERKPCSGCALAFMIASNSLHLGRGLTVVAFNFDRTPTILALRKTEGWRCMTSAAARGKHVSIP
jgi:hypothetical protein